MTDSKFRKSRSVFSGMASCLVAASLTVLTAGCSLVALGIAGSLGNPDMKKIDNAREVGYAVSFRLRDGDEASSEGDAAPAKASVNGTSFTMLTTGEYIILDIVRKNGGSVTRRMRVVEHPARSLYALELSVPAEKNTHKRYAYAFPDESTLSRAIGFADFHSVKGLSGYLLSVKDADCTRPSNENYRDLELLTSCKGKDFRYVVNEFANFDNGFIFPKYFSYRGPASLSHDFVIEGVKNVNASKVKSSNKLLSELDRDFRQKLNRGLAKEADASDVEFIRKLAGD